MKWLIRIALRRMIDEHMKNAKCTIAYIQHMHLDMEAAKDLWNKVEWEQRYADRIRKILKRYL